MDSPELRILLELLRSGGARPEHLHALLRADVDWSELVRLARGHAVAPVCHENLSRLGRTLVPATVMDQLDRFRLSNARTVLRLTHELGELLDILGNAGIPAIPFKGPVLAADLYGDIALRQFGDLDILVRKSDFWDTIRLLTSRGFVPEAAFSPLQQKFYLRDNCALYLSFPSQRFLDLQWQFAPDFNPVRFDMDDIFRRAVTRNLEGRPVPALPDVENLLYLAFHGSLHAWARLSYLVDMARLIESRDWSWPELLRKAEQAGMKLMFLVGLGLCSEALAMPLDPLPKQEIERSRSIRRQRESALARLARNRGAQPGTLRTTVIRLTLLDSLAGQLSYAVRRAVVPSPADWAFASIPDRWYPLYYAVRPVRLSLVALRTLVRLPRSNPQAGAKIETANDSLVLNGVDFAELSAEVLGASASIRFRAHGSSMSPFIREGDILTVDPAHPRELVRGDVVLYRSAGGRAVAHRLLGRRGGRLLIRGDADAGECERVRPEKILGIVVQVERGGRKLPPNSLIRRTTALLWAATPTAARRVVLGIGRRLRGSRLTGQRT